MAFPNQNALKGAIAELKEIVSRLHGAETEPIHLIKQIESGLNELERKSSTTFVAPAMTVQSAPVSF